VKVKKLASHLRIARYGTFHLTDAIRPSLDLQVIPKEGFRLDIYKDQQNRLEVPVLAVAASREKLFDLFLGLLKPLGPTADVILESSHHSSDNNHEDLHREHIEMPVLMSYFCDFEDLLMNDGCTGVAVISNQEPMEIQFDEHKLLIVYAHDLEPFERIVRQFGLMRDDKLKLITEGEHLHSTDERFAKEFEHLSYSMGTGAAAERVSW
jgi:hypothetical protein